MRVLVACEFSAVVRDAFRALGHDAWSNDILPCEADPQWHIEGDCFDAIEWFGPWDLIIAHPPCTFLANSGVRWLYGGKGTVRDPQRWKDMEDGARFFKRFLDYAAEHPEVKMCVENPIMHGYGKDIIGVEPTQIIQPWMFGHGETKATCLWLVNLPVLEPTKVVSGRHPRVAFAPPGPDRWKERSRFYPGFAEAMAQQWGGRING